MPVQTSSVGTKDMVSELKKYLAKSSEGEPYIGPVHRLDQPVEGIVVFAKTQKAAASLSEQVREGGGMHKEYLARVYGRIPKPCGRLEDYMIKERSNMSRIAGKNEKGAQKAVLEYTCIEEDEYTQLLRIILHSGRHHQIRLQLSHAGAPVLGDKRYGTAKALDYANENGIKRLHLAAVRLEFTHPLSGIRKCFEADIKI
ncbi:MAG: RNA pseudouridine synthase [Lachnospiraceae bacterium]|nr:RNA pseudouridine synthase [Lachnospiraceae bacterium]